MRKTALLVGVEDYQDRSISPLRYAVADVGAVADRLKTVCGFDTVRVLADKTGPNAPDLGNVLDALSDSIGELRPNDVFLFFFSGHGVEVNDRAYLLTRDSRQSFPEHMSLSVDLLQRHLNAVQADRKIIVLDACRNDPRAGKGDGANIMSDMMAKDISCAVRDESRTESVTALLSACRPGQRAYEWPAKEHGVFTHFLLEGLDGAAWKGNRLTFRQLAGYAAKEVRRWSTNTPSVALAQEPWYEEFGGGEEIELAQVQTATPHSKKPRPKKPQRRVQQKRRRPPAEPTPLSLDSLRQELLRNPNDKDLRKLYLVSRTEELEHQDRNEVRNYIARRVTIERVVHISVIAVICGAVMGIPWEGSGPERVGGVAWAILGGIIGGVAGALLSRHKKNLDSWALLSFFLLTIGCIAGRLLGRTDDGSIANDWEAVQEGSPVGLYFFAAWLATIPAFILRGLASMLLGSYSWGKSPNKEIARRSELGPLPRSAYRLNVNQAWYQYMGRTPPREE